MGFASALALLLALSACGSQSPSTPEARLAAYLATHEVTKLDRESFHQIIVEPFRDLYDDYAAQPIPERPISGPVTVRRHFANDPSLTPAQGRLRWMLPVMYPSYAAAGTVFVEIHGEWRSLAGLDEVMLARVRTLDATCADRLSLAGPVGNCTNAGWVIADAALRHDTARFARACQLAASACTGR
ncbi:MAG TPA: hypothetical protein VMZ53_28995 [Kofleriaceae bacterium]|nr:hypothetical protein [Kofleriaceae bacterium]